jgi:hypothetical protein
VRLERATVVGVDEIPQEPADQSGQQGHPDEDESRPALMPEH